MQRSNDYLEKAFNQAKENLKKYEKIIEELEDKSEGQNRNLQSNLSRIMDLEAREQSLKQKIKKIKNENELKHNQLTERHNQQISTLKAER